ncbi:MAG: LytTR family transcriptional regulator DNA-binding domain-containing protein [Bacteroidales bacterium]|nr:LytTR family transcriptional regulator DNA-binding domain-containing protein [Bacteroidales bacterium]
MENITINNKEKVDNKLEEIVFLESVGNFTRKYCCNESEGLLVVELSRLENTLPKEKFFKINQLNIINADYLKRIQGRTIKNVLLHGGIELYIDQDKYWELLKFLKLKYNIW